MKKIGTVLIKNLPVLMEDFMGKEYIEFLKTKGKNDYFRDKKDNDEDALNQCSEIIKANKFDKNFSRYTSRIDENPFFLFLNDRRQRAFEHLIKIEEYKELMGLQYDLYYTDDAFSLISYRYDNDIHYMFIPTNYLQVNLFKDYADVPANRLIQEAYADSMLIGKNALSALDDASLNSLETSIEEKQREIEDAKKDIEKVKEEKKAEMERIRLEIEQKYTALMEELDRKQVELIQQQKALEAELFMLDTQIYAIRCFLGETIQFKQIAFGKNADDREPVVLYQKMRFLDEEMGKILSIYRFNDDDKPLFEQMLSAREDIREYFLPGGKSIALVKLSADGKIYVPECQMSYSGGRNASAYANNIMSEYKLYHGNQIAILVRNGDNCYLGWTDSDRVSLSTDNMFLEKKTTVEPYEEKKYTWESDRRRAEKEAEERKEKEKRDVASRYFIFSILQGISQQSNILSLKDGNILKPDGKNVIYSLADNWITDNRYGNLDDILNKTNVNIKKGDEILILRGLSAEGEKYKSFNNDRGRGYANRTHDVYCKNNTIIPINLVEAESNWYVHYEHDGVKCKTKGRMDNVRLTESCTNLEEVEETQYHYFVSLEKDENWRRTYDLGYDDGYRARANFEIYKDEFINLTFLNSEYIRYVIFNKKAVKQNIGGYTVNFSYILPYLNHALEYLKHREESEAALLTEAGIDLSGINDWMVKLSEWKLENDVHSITPYQAKRVAKAWQK